jgi:hypothetical protein
MTVSLAALRRTLVQIDKRFLDYLVYGFLKLDPGSPEAGDLPLTTVVRLALADWMSHLGFLSDHQKVMILEARGRQIIEWAERAAATRGDAEKPPYTLTVSDTRYVHTSEDVTWFDLTRDEERQSLSRPAVTHVTCDVLELLRTVEDRLGPVGPIHGGRDATAGADRRDRPIQAAR